MKTKLIHDDNRERELQALVNRVLNTEAYWSNNYNTGETWDTCPFCNVEVSEYTPMKDIEHKLDCAYLIAKDLKSE